MSRSMYLLPTLLIAVLAEPAHAINYNDLKIDLTPKDGDASIIYVSKSGETGPDTRSILRVTNQSAQPVDIKQIFIYPRTWATKIDFAPDPKWQIERRNNGATIKLVPASKQFLLPASDSFDIIVPPLANVSANQEEKLDITVNDVNRTYHVSVVTREAIGPAGVELALTSLNRIWVTPASSSDKESSLTLEIRNKKDREIPADGNTKLTLELTGLYDTTRGKAKTGGPTIKSETRYEIAPDNDPGKWSIMPVSANGKLRFLGAHETIKLSLPGIVSYAPPGNAKLHFRLEGIPNAQVETGAFDLILSNPEPKIDTLAPCQDKPAKPVYCLTWKTSATARVTLEYQGEGGTCTLSSNDDPRGKCAPGEAKIGLNGDYKVKLCSDTGFTLKAYGPSTSQPAEESIQIVADLTSEQFAATCLNGGSASDLLKALTNRYPELESLSTDTDIQTLAKLLASKHSRSDTYRAIVRYLKYKEKSTPENVKTLFRTLLTSDHTENLGLLGTALNEERFGSIQKGLQFSNDLHLSKDGYRTAYPSYQQAEIDQVFSEDTVQIVLTLLTKLDPQPADSEITTSLQLTLGLTKAASVQLLNKLIDDSLERHWPQRAPLVGDVNGDGLTDLIWNKSPASTTIAVALGRYDGTFKFLPLQGMPREVEQWQQCETLVGDVNGNGPADLILVEVGGRHRISVGLAGEGGAFHFGSTQEPKDLPDCEWGGVRMGDINGDGRADLIRAGKRGPIGCDRAYVFMGQEDGSFDLSALPNTAPNKGAVSYGYSGWRAPMSLIGTEDLNRDKRGDLRLIETPPSHRFQIFYSSQDPAHKQTSNSVKVDFPPWTEAQILKTRSPTDLVGDVNGDGLADIIWSNTNASKTGGDNITWIYGGGVDTQGNIRLLTPPVRVHDERKEDLRSFNTLIGDVDGDGRADLIWNRMEKHGNLIYVGLGRRADWPKPGTSGDFKAFSFLGVQTNRAAEGWWPEKWEGYTTLIGDVNGDGCADLIWIESGRVSTMRIYVGLGQRNGSFLFLWPQEYRLFRRPKGEGK